jgi:hypothetical protein
VAGNQLAGASVLFAYPLGKARALPASIFDRANHTHGAVERRFNGIYRDGGIACPQHIARSAPPKTDDARADLAPPMAKTAPGCGGSAIFRPAWHRMDAHPWHAAAAIHRSRLRSIDHADWPAPGSAIRASGAERV